MVALTLTPEQLRASADAARADARRLRVQSHARRVEAQRGISSSANRRARASVMLAWLERTRELRYQSTWSDLPWQMPDGELDLVLVAHDGDGAARARARLEPSSRPLT